MWSIFTLDPSCSTPLLYREQAAILDMAYRFGPPMMDSTTKNRFTLLRALFLLGVRIAPVKIALAFVPSTTRSPLCRSSIFRSSHYHPSCSRHHVGARQSSVRQHYDVPCMVLSLPAAVVLILGIATATCNSLVTS